MAGATDAGTPFNLHGDLWYQLCLLAEHGLTNLQALAAGTSGSAKAVGIYEKTGSLEQGKQADILVIGGDPEKDLKNLKNVQAVWRSGKKII